MLFHGYVIVCDQHVDEPAECRLFDIQRLNVFSQGGGLFLAKEAFHKRATSVVLHAFCKRAQSFESFVWQGCEYRLVVRMRDGVSGAFLRCYGIFDVFRTAAFLLLRGSDVYKPIEVFFGPCPTDTESLGDVCDSRMAFAQEVVNLAARF